MHACLCSNNFLCFFFSIWDSNPGNGATQFRLGLPTSNNTIKTIFHKQANRPINPVSPSLRLSPDNTRLTMNSNYAFVTPSPHTLPYLLQYLLKLHVFVCSIICNVSYISQSSCVQGQGHGRFCWVINVHAWPWLPTYLWDDSEGGRREGWVGQAWPLYLSLYVSAGWGFLRSGVSLAKHISDG